MTDNVTLISGVASRYATALLDLSEEQGSVAEVEKALTAFEKLLQDSEDLRRLVTSPVFSADEQVKALDAILDKAGIAGLAGNFIRLAARNRRLFAVPSMIAAFRAALAERRGELPADVISATELSKDQLDTLTTSLNEATGKSVVVSAKVDPSLIGGLIVKVGSRMIDTSLKTKLNSLKIAMKEVG